MIGLFTLALHGWGLAARRSIGLRRGNWPTTVTIGIAVLVFLGGVLNLLAIALPVTLAGLLAIGLLLSVQSLRNRTAESALRAVGGRGHSIRDHVTKAIVYSIAIVSLLFAVWTQLPPQVYNHDDDFGKYFAQPARMIQTGSVFGSPLSSIGSDCLGGQAFLQGFIVAFFPIAYINGLDAVFGQFLCLMLASQFCGRRRQFLAAPVICMLSALFINPMYVNVSSLYIGSAFIMSLILLTTDLGEFGEVTPEPKPLVLGLLYGSLIALKFTFALFVALHLPALAFALAVSTRQFRRGVQWGINTSLSCVLFLSPWLLLHTPSYLSASRTSLFGRGIVVDNRVAETFSLFSRERLAYGASIAHYTWLAISMGLIALIMIRLMRTDDTRFRLSAAMTIAACATGTASYVIVLFVFGPRLSGVLHSVRYFAPFAIAIWPAAVGLMTWQLAGTRLCESRAIRAAIPSLLALAFLIAFWPSLRDRLEQALSAGCVLAFSGTATSTEYQQHSQNVLYGRARAQVSAAQQSIPAAESIVAWIDTPFHLDFVRNQVFEVESAGLTNPWASIPAARYVLWQYNGMGNPSPDIYARIASNPGAYSRKIAACCMDFRDRLRSLANRGKVLFDDGSIVAFRLPEKTGKS